MNKDIVNAAVTGMAVGAIVNAMTPDLNTPEAELERRRLAAMSTEQLQQEVQCRQDQQEESNKFWSYVALIIGCFIFPWVCIPILFILGLIAAFKGERQQIPVKVEKKPMTPWVKWFIWVMLAISVGLPLLTVAVVSIKDQIHQVK